MPELPEVETIRRDLDREFVGRKVKTVEVSRLRSIRRHKNTKDFAGRLEGRKITGVVRKGKYILIRPADLWRDVRHDAGPAGGAGS